MKSINKHLLLPSCYLLIMMLASGMPLRPSLLFVPIAILLASMFTMGVGLILSTMVIYFADVFEMFQILLLSWFYLQPLMYPISIIPEAYHGLFRLNPMYHFLNIFRMPIYEGQLAPLRDIGIAALIAITTLLLGWWIFTRKADQFAYRV